MDISPRDPQEHETFQFGSINQGCSDNEEDDEILQAVFPLAFATICKPILFHIIIPIHSNPTHLTSPTNLNPHSGDFNHLLFNSPIITNNSSNPQVNNDVIDTDHNDEAESIHSSQTAIARMKYDTERFCCDTSKIEDEDRDLVEEIESYYDQGVQ